MAKGRFISYLRVSTQKQGHSGLGLEAQREAVNNYLNGGHWKLVAEMVEVESGKCSNNRPKLSAALSLCRVHNATLLVAKLDRLARNVAFTSTLLESGAKVIAVDMPDADVTMLQMYSVIAEREAKAISERTRAALKAAKARGVKLGGLRNRNIRAAGMKGSKVAAQLRSEAALKRATDLMPMVKAIQAEGASTLAAIAAGLNDMAVPTAHGCRWTPQQVKRLLSYA